MQSTVIRKRDGLIPEVEKLLIAWINDQIQRIHMPLNQATISARHCRYLKRLRTGAVRHQRMKFSVLAKDGLNASGRELVGITLEFKGKLQAPTLKQRGIFHKR
jgi:hypothetical protein